MTAPAASPAPEPKKDDKKAEAGHAGSGGAKETWLPRSAEAMGRRIKNIAFGTWNRVWGVLGAGVRGTVAQPIGEMGEAGRRLGMPESKQEGLFRKLAEVIEQTNTAVMNVLRKPLDFAVGTFHFVGTMPGRVGGRTLHAVQDAWEVIKKGKLPEAIKGSAESIGEAGHAAPAHA